jgi:hypothetical protein
VVGAVLGPLLGKYRPIPAALVADAMVRVAAQDLASRTFESDDIRRLASAEVNAAFRSSSGSPSG